jgi:hypothetical protein
MQKNKKIKKISILFIWLILIFSGCRDDIINPDNKAGNVNEPIILSNNSYFSFYLNADKITYYVLEQAKINVTEFRLYISIDDYKAGYLEIAVSDNNHKLLYFGRFSKKTNAFYKDISGYVPQHVVINFNNFSGSLKFELISLI